MSRDEAHVLCHTPTPGKAPTRIPRWKYDAVRDAMLAVVPRDRDGVRFRDLPDLVAGALAPDDRARLGSIMWHVTTVKLHLETIGELERIPKSSPQRVRRVT